MSAKKKPYESSGRCPECGKPTLRQGSSRVDCESCKWGVELRHFPLPGADGYYVGEDGEAYSVHKGFRRLARKTNRGVVRTRISVEGRHYYPYLAPAVLIAFGRARPPAFGPHYADGDRGNCRLDNLSWRLLRASQSTAELFVRTWQGAQSVGEVADTIGMEITSAYQRAIKMRDAGVPLKKLPLGRAGRLDYESLADLARELDGQHE